VGFQGSDEQVIRQAAHAAPQLLSAFSSASSMWTANAAGLTVGGQRRWQSPFHRRQPEQ
jgi:succinylarginine dihydrolase